MATSGSTVIRVFLSSTFVDFQEERSLLVKQVFPSLRRRARSRGVEIVDVDLRWGVTADQTERGETLPLCLAEIDRCRPYFISLLGERYGWVPPADPTYYKPALLERQPWLKERMGGASLTELEILHGVLRNPEMAGHAFFYLRDPAYAQAQPEPGWVADNLQERQRLSALKEEVRRSGFPVSEGLTAPQAIAERIEADLWAVIEREHPEQEPQDPLQQEQQRHSDYRRARTGLYLGGETAITQLESWIEEGEQRILITGESGAGKSALIANWLEAHQKSAPQDLVHAHHLGCTNDASAVRPLLGRLIDTASLLLLEEKQIADPLKVPQDWWELVAEVAETLRSLGRWCEQQGRRWVWVLDGLDRLDPDDQKALPWLPKQLPAGIVVIASALACQASEILDKRGYIRLTIRPLGRVHQEKLIQRYLTRYNKELDGGLLQLILDHPLAGSPLFLKVLLEELRQCGRHDTLQQQLAFYLISQSVDDLYERVLERLENDGSGVAVNKVMTALWASRAGLTEPELLAITDLKHLQWAPIDLALEKAFGRNGNRLVFDHDYLRIAVQDRYLPTDEERRQAHSVLADWYGVQSKWDDRKAEELPWQLQEAGRTNDLRTLLLRVSELDELARKRDDREVINYWRLARAEGDGELDELIEEAVEQQIAERQEDAADLIWFVDHMAALLDEAGLYRELLLRLRTLSLELEEATDREEAWMLSSLAWLADAHRDMGNYEEAETLYLRCMEASERLLGPEHPDTLITVGNLAVLFEDKGDYEQAEAYYKRELEARERLLGPEHPSTLNTVGNLAGLLRRKGDYEQAEAYYTRCLEASERLLGPEHPSTLITVGNLGLLYSNKGDYEQAEAYFQRCLEASERLLGPEHPSTLTTVGNLGLLYSDKGDYEQAEAFFKRDLEASERLLGPEHPSTLTTVGNLGLLYSDKGDYEQAEAFFKRDLEASERLLGPEHPSTNNTRYFLANLLSYQRRYSESIPLLRLEWSIAEQRDGRNAPGTLSSLNQLAIDLRETGELEEAETLFRELLEARRQVLKPSDFGIGQALGGLAKTLEEAGRLEQAAAIAQQALDHRHEHEGPDSWWTNRKRLDLARLLQKLGRDAEALPLLEQLQASLGNLDHPDDEVPHLLAAACDLLNLITAER